MSILLTAGAIFGVVLVASGSLLLLVGVACVLDEVEYPKDEQG